MNNKIKNILVNIFGLFLWLLLFIFIEQKTLVSICFIISIATTLLTKRINFYNKMDESSQKYFKKYVIIGSIITILSLLILALCISK